tara:strand:+ start:855 stop:1208 length:354 start_codon:yes stop_codon:yes gene_type:complete
MENLSFNEYQREAKATAIYPNGLSEGIGLYPILGLAEEAGEVVGKVAKFIRKQGDQRSFATEELSKDVALEIGDCLWMIANIAQDFGYNLEDVARMNLDKLRDRKERGVIEGSGDKR